MTSSNCSSDEELARGCSRIQQRHQPTTERCGFVQQHRVPVDGNGSAAAHRYFVNNYNHFGSSAASELSYDGGSSENNRQQSLQSWHLHQKQQQQLLLQQQQQSQQQQQVANYQQAYSTGFFDIGNRNALLSSANAMRSTERKPLFPQQLIPEANGMPHLRSFTFDAHQLEFGNGGSQNLTQLSPMLEETTRSYLDLDHRQGQRSNRMRMEQHPADTASRLTINPCYDDLKALSGGLPDYGTVVSGTNLSPPHVRLFDASDDSNNSNSDLPRSRRTSTSSSTKRGDRKSIPDSQKDERYFERREKNNAAAKKSRDTRKQRIETAMRERDRLKVEGEYLEAQLAAWRTACDNMRAMLRQANETDRTRSHVTGLLFDGSDNARRAGITLTSSR